MTSTTATLAQIALDRSGAPAVFLRHGLDFCCRGQRSLAEACREKAIDPQQVIRELDGLAAPAAGAGSWSDRTLGELVDFILARYHAPLRGDVRTLIALAAKVEQVHAEKASCPRGLTAHLTHVLEELDSHLGKEEQIVFPAIRQGTGAALMPSVKALMQEHEDHGESLQRTRQLTADLVVPPEGCTSWRALYSGLTRLEQELMEHIHLENYVLFPRAVNGDGDLGRGS
jgi:regulator of cell morphogenesis and NO signaling